MTAPPVSRTDTWIPSRFNISADLPDGRRAIFNTFTAAFAMVQDGTWRRCLAAGSQCQAHEGDATDTALTLLDKGFLVADDVDELDLLRIHFQSGRYNQDVIGATIVPTVSCNLQCSYCFEGAAQEMDAPAAMSEAMEDAVVRRLALSARGRMGLEISWFGGEPLLAPGVIQRISGKLIPACDHAGLDYSASLLTNGTLLKPELVESLAECRLKFIQVTVDVPKAEKQDRAGRDTLGLTLDNINAAADTLPIHLRINLVRDVEEEFDELYEELLRRNLQERLKTVDIAGLTNPECGRNSCQFRPVSQQAFYEASTRERHKAKALGLPIRTLLLMGPTGCTATNRAAMVIGPDGLLYKCLEDVGLAGRAYGSVLEEQPSGPANLLPWLTHDWFELDQCRDCPALPECGGGCPHIRMYQPEKMAEGDYCRWHLRDLETRVRDYALETREDEAQPETVSPAAGSAG